MDKLTQEQRHRCMAAVKSRGTKPELWVRKYLFARGYRYRLYDKRLPGHPDLVLPRYRTVIFVNGCFWHGHEGCQLAHVPKTNTAFWEAKIARNRARDAHTKEALKGMGWHVVTLWTCELRPKQRLATLAHLEYALNKLYLDDRRPARPYDVEEEGGNELARAAEPAP